MTDMLDRNAEQTPWFLRGNYAPVFDEVTDTNLSVTGSIPSGLSGLYVRNGSNPKTARPDTGSSATAWCTACVSKEGERSGTATGTCALRST